MKLMRLLFKTTFKTLQFSFAFILWMALKSFIFFCILLHIGAEIGRGSRAVDSKIDAFAENHILGATFAYSKGFGYRNPRQQKAN